MTAPTTENLLALWRGLPDGERSAFFRAALGLTAPRLQSLANPHTARSRVIYQMATMAAGDLAVLAALVDGMAGVPPEMGGR